MELEKRTVIVTGAAGGIGAATAKVLAQAGANVVVTDIGSAGEHVAKEIESDGGTAVFIPADLTVEAEVESLVARTVERFGRLDGAFNNAGVEQCATPLHELTAEQWERAVQVDLTGVFYCLKHQIAAMLETGGGSIVNTASSLAQVAIPNASEYVAAKHGVLGLTRAAAADYGQRSIRVNAVLPGITETPMVARLVDPVTWPHCVPGT